MKKFAKAASIVGFSTATLVMGSGSAYANSPSATVISTEADSGSGALRAVVRVAGFPPSADIQLLQCATNLQQQMACSEEVIDAQTDETGAATQSIAVSQVFTGFNSETLETVEVDCTSAEANCFIMSIAFAKDSSQVTRADAALGSIWN